MPRPGPTGEASPRQDASDVKTSILGRLGGNALSGLALARMLRQDPERATASALRLVSRMGDLKGIAMKIGQILSYTDFALPDEARAILATLQRHSSSMSWQQAETIVHEQLGEHADRLLAGMERKPVASASIGQVFRGSIDDVAIAVKVQYPGIDKAIQNDFALAGIGPAVAKLVYPGSQDIKGILAEARQRFLEECDYVHEAAYQERFRKLWQDHPVLVIPRVLDAYTTHRVLTMEWMEGQIMEEWLAKRPGQAARDAAAEAIWDFYIGTLLLHGLYNGDPHPGNQLYLQDGRIAILDHGCARHFDPGQVRSMARLILAVQSGSDDELDTAIKDVGITRNGRDLEVARDLMRAFFSPLHDPRRAADARMDLATAMSGKRKMMRLSIPPEFLLLLRIRFGMAALIGRLDAHIDWGAKERQLAEAVLSD